VNSPFGLMLAHNGNLTNADQLKQDMFLQDLRHMNTNSDSEVLLNVLAHELQAASTQVPGRCRDHLQGRGREFIAASRAPMPWWR
jgi:glutamine phosphoribosylpyrophosphate amidotransferase